MKISVHTIANFSQEQVRTEIRFCIASARAVGNDLVCLKHNFKDESAGKLASLVIKNLKAIKKEGKLDFFADKEAFDNLRAEASYLINKFPEVVDIVTEDGFLLFVKL